MMRLVYGRVRLDVIDITRFERTTVWSDDGTDLIGVDVVLGVTATYAPGGAPALPSVTKLSTSTLQMIRGPNVLLSTPEPVALKGGGGGGGGGGGAGGPLAIAPGGGGLFGGGILSAAVVAAAMIGKAAGKGGFFDVEGLPPENPGAAAAVAAGAAAAKAILDAIAGVTGGAVGAVPAVDNTNIILQNTPRGNDPTYVTPSLETDVPLLSQPVAYPLQHTGPETDAELRMLLWLPRQKLQLIAYSKTSGQEILWLDSPRPGFTVDVANGPKPLSVDIVSAIGEPNSTVIHFQVRTRMSPCPVGSDRLVLSHRWQMTHVNDENNYLTRVINGQIVFNPAVVALQGVNPDFVRAQFLHPIPLGYERKVPEVSASEDGCVIRYTIADTDPTIVFDAGDSGAVQIEIKETLETEINRGIPDTEWGFGRIYTGGR